MWKKIRTLLSEVRITFRAGGVRGVLQKFGWKILAAFFLYYLIRDSILYILIPYLIAKNLFGDG